MTEETGTLQVMGPYRLDRPMAKPDPCTVPLRGDVAHVGLAGTYFVPHYAVPVTHVVGPAGAKVCGSNQDGADCRAELEPGSTFDVLDVEGEFAWGCVTMSGPVGWVRLDSLGIAA